MNYSKKAESEPIHTQFLSALRDPISNIVIQAKYQWKLMDICGSLKLWDSKRLAVPIAI